MNRSSHTLLAAACLCAFGALPAWAASEKTEAFVANARPNVNFLDRSSRLALDKASSPRVRAFAHSEAEEQTIAANSFVAWAETHTPRGEAVAVGGMASAVTAPIGGALSGAGAGANQVLSPLGPVGAVAALPLDAAGQVTTGVGNAVGGVAGGGGAVRSQRQLIGGGMLPANQNDMDHLNSTNGRQFETLYRSTQRDALRQLAVLYRDYAANGDDPALRDLASRELPKVNRRLEQLDGL